MNNLEVKKLYIDSRYRTVDSKSDSNFKIQLGRSITLPENTVMWVESCLLYHSWFTIEENVNDRMYLMVMQHGIPTSYTMIQIPSTNYTGSQLASTLQSILNSTYPSLFTVVSNLTKNNMTISVAGTTSFKILTDSELSTGYQGFWGGITYDFTNPNSCNDIITNRTPIMNNQTQPWTSGMLNLQGFRSVYVTSSALSNFNVLGPQGENNILKKVLTTSDFGYLIIDTPVSEEDFINVGKLTLNTIDFQFRDVKGNEIPFHDSPVSFTIVFAVKET
jgi:hypothetical protein